MKGRTVFGALSFLVLILAFPDPSTCQEPMTSENGRPLRANSSSNVFVVEVRAPGTSIVPSTGRLLQIYELNNELLKGMFITSQGIRISFESHCSGFLQLKHGRKTFLKVQSIGNTEDKLLYGMVNRKSFVYDDQLEHIFELPKINRRGRRAQDGSNSKRTRRSVEEHWHRSKRSEAPTAERDLVEEEKTLAKHTYYRQLPNLVQALGEFGLTIATSPCAKAVIMTGLNVNEHLHTGSNSTAMNDAIEKNIEKRRQVYNNALDEMERGEQAKFREKRFWGGRRRRRNWIRTAFRVVKDIVTAPINLVRNGLTSLFNAFDNCPRHNTGRLCYYKTSSGWPRCNRCSGSRCQDPGAANGRPCTCEYCPGLCGIECNCVRLFCGNCCYHRGCFEHDICCAHKGGPTLVCRLTFLTGGGSFSCRGGFDPYPDCNL